MYKLFDNKKLETEATSDDKWLPSSALEVAFGGPKPEGGSKTALFDDTETDEIKKGIDMVLDYLINNKSNALSDYQSKKSKMEIMNAAKHQLELRGYDKETSAKVMNLFEKYLWGYYILDDFLNEESISDIKCYGSNHIQLKTKGERSTSDIHFSNIKDYQRFVQMVAVKNKVSLSDINALQTFTDKSSNENARLRFCICTPFLSDIDEAYLSIRKIPKHKFTMDDLVREGMFTSKQKEYFIKQAKSASGILVTGKGASGKSTFMNAMLEEIPHNRSGAVFQENEELFTYSLQEGGHPDLMFQHVVENKGEGRINYSLADLVRMGLVFDLDYCIIGEIKGKEAADFMMASYTGQQCWCSVHGKDSQEGVYKLADYVQQATGYTLPECLKMLSGISHVVFLDHFKVTEITEINGYDYNSNQLIMEKVNFDEIEAGRR